MRDLDTAVTLLASANPLPRDLADSFAVRFDAEAGITEAIRRARATQARDARRPPAIAIAAIATFVLGVASALALVGRPTIDFFSSKKAPRLTYVSFDRGARLRAFLSGIRPPRSGTPGHTIALAAPARLITGLTYDGRRYVLAVAPLQGGGFCSSWRGAFLSGSCVVSRAKAANSISAHLPVTGQGPLVLYGSFVEPAGARLELSFQDGTSSAIPAVWVSPPISAGFFLYEIPGAHRRAGHLPVSLSLLDAHGGVIARERFPA